MSWVYDIVNTVQQNACKFALIHDISQSPGAFPGVAPHKSLSRHPVTECKDHDHVTPVSTVDEGVD